MYEFTVNEDGTITYGTNKGILYNRRIGTNQIPNNKLPQTGIEILGIIAFMSVSIVAIGGSIYCIIKLRKIK